MVVPGVSFRECFLDWELTSNLCFALKFATLLPCKATDSSNLLRGFDLIKFFFFTYNTKIDTQESFIFFTYYFIKKVYPAILLKEVKAFPDQKMITSGIL